MERGGSTVASDAAGEGGDPACWSEQVCDACGQMTDAGDTHRCPRPLSADDVESFAREGFLGVPALVGPDDLATLRSACDDVLDAGDSDGDRLLGGLIRQVVLPHQAHPTFADNAALSAGIDIAKQLFGKDEAIRVYDQIIHKPAGDPNTTPWHQDQSYVEEPFAPAGSPIGDNAAMFWVALDDVDVATSCMHFIPGVHREPLLPHHVAGGSPDDPGRMLAITDPETHFDVAATVPVPLSAGGCTIHAAGTPHMTPPNTSPDRDRRAYIFTLVAY
ncbi:phytanoyl-CoA dioxygenase family protein [Actinospongicola halichondriae]|uniref:phytanoyl-CoA dioxygenase family protein n=1 Tax=Actinospongicola halichondriae TaxID=3236844 RepID=UPI003D57BD66